MLRFTFESFFTTVPELRKELVDLLWKIDHTWPMTIDTKNIHDTKNRIDTSVVKLSEGATRISIDNTTTIHDHKDTCSCCPNKGDNNHDRKEGTRRN